MIKFLKHFGLPLLGLIGGSVLFFPWNDVRDQISSLIYKQTRVQVQMQSFSPTLGLSVGVSKGSLLAFSATKASIRLPSGQMILCNELIVGPRFWPLLMTQIQISLGCFSEDGGNLTALLSAMPFWGPTSASVSVAMENFSMENISLQSSVQGTFNGKVDVSEVKVQEGGIPAVSWDLDGKNVRTPEANMPGMNLPSLDVDTLATQGSLSARAIKVDSLSFGTSNTLIEGKLKFQSDINESFAPQTGELSGTLRIEPNAEKGALGNVVSWKTVFGPGDEKGQRQFKRPFNGGVQSLFLTPYNPNPTP